MPVLQVKQSLLKSFVRMCSEVASLASLNTIIESALAEPANDANIMLTTATVTHCLVFMICPLSVSARLIPTGLPEFPIPTSSPRKNRQNNMPAALWCQTRVTRPWLSGKCARWAIPLTGLAHPSRFCEGWVSCVARPPSSNPAHVLAHRKSQNSCQAPKPSNQLKTNWILIAWEFHPIRYN